MAMCTVLVRKQSCKHANRLIWGHHTTQCVFFLDEKSWCFAIFHRFFPRFLWWNTHIVTSTHCRYPRRVHTSWYPCRESVSAVSHVHRPPRTTVSSCRGITSLRSKSTVQRWVELTIITTGVWEESLQCPLTGPIPQRWHLRYPHPLDEVTRRPPGPSHRWRNTSIYSPRTWGGPTWTPSLHRSCFQ